MLSWAFSKLIFRNMSYSFLDLRDWIALWTIIIELDICLPKINPLYYFSTSVPIKGLSVLATIFVITLWMDFQMKIGLNFLESMKIYFYSMKVRKVAFRAFNIHLNLLDSSTASWKSY
jgi:hypothetical protein